MFYSSNQNKLSIFTLKFKLTTATFQNNYSNSRLKIIKNFTQAQKCYPSLSHGLLDKFHVCLGGGKMLNFLKEDLCREVEINQSDQMAGDGFLGKVRLEFNSLISFPTWLSNQLHLIQRNKRLERSSALLRHSKRNPA